MPSDPRELSAVQARSRLRDVMVYMCAKYPSPDELSNARLTKLVYLADWEAARHFRHQITGVQWVFNHYGPWVPDVVELASADTATFVIVDEHNAFGSPKTRIGLNPDVSTGNNLDGAERAVIDRVIDETRRLYFGQFIDYVYATYPVEVSHRYARFDLSALAANAENALGKPEPLSVPNRSASWQRFTDDQLRALFDRVEAELTEHLGSSLTGSIASDVDIWLEQATLEHVEVTSLDDIQDPGETSLSDEWTVLATGTMSIEGFIEKTAFHSESGIPAHVEVQDDDWNDQYMWVSWATEAFFEFTVNDPFDANPVVELIEATLEFPAPQSGPLI